MRTSVVRDRSLRILLILASLGPLAARAPSAVQPADSAVRADGLRVATPAGSSDCNGNGIPDDEDLSHGTSADCNMNGAPDECDLQSAATQYVENLSPSSHLLVLGAHAHEALGRSVAGAGDVNGDGAADALIGGGRYIGINCRGNSADGGEAYVLFGGPRFRETRVDLSTLDGANGFVLLRRDPLVEGPSIVAAVGDVNGDRAADVLMCLPMTSVEGAQEAGECYLVFGGPEVGASGEVALSGLDVTTGVKIRRAMPGELLGWSARGAGDVNADGYDDFLIGSFAGTTAYLVFGGRDWQQELHLEDLHGAPGPPATRGVRLLLNDGVLMPVWGRSVAGAGDFNSDGVTDMIVGAPTANSGEGLAVVVFGHENPWPSSLDLLSFARGVVFHGGENAITGFSLAALGDVNQDGRDDLFLGTPGIQDSRGAGYILFGGSHWNGSYQLNQLPESAGVRLDGPDKLLTAGADAAAAGDVDGDGVPDVMLSQAGLSGPAGFGDKTFVVYGGAHLDESGGVLQLADLNGLNGYTLRAENDLDRTGVSLAGVGDLDQDGFDDIAIGASGFGSMECEAGPGAVYFAYGHDRRDLDSTGGPDVCYPPCPRPLASNPPHEAIDAGQPFDVDSGEAQGWRSITMTYAHPVPDLNAEQYSTSSVGGDAPAIRTVLGTGDRLAVEFDAPIPVGAWTTLAQECAVWEARLGFLPADANGDRISSPLDILAMIDDLNSVEVLPAYSTDIDRSGQTNPSDLLKLIDLLNGAGDFPAFNGVALPDP
jgi:hypothetical protein